MSGKEIKLAAKEEGDEDNRVCLNKKMKRTKDHFLAPRSRVVVQSTSIKSNSLLSRSKVLSHSMYIWDGS